MFAHRTWFAGFMAILLLAGAPGISLGITVPDTVSLNSSGKLYEPFQFNHAKHIQLTKECSDCHHHTTGTLLTDPNCIRCHRNSSETKIVSCRGCHAQDPFTAETIKDNSAKLKMYHRDKPGLKGAMHQSCINCHSKIKGPTGCKDCHARKKAGDEFYNSGEFTPKPKPGNGHGNGH